ncbi:TPA: transposase [Candidatus Poribacteria bacterium]|nr:transposase [Candidatus Poribacteria bacterium]
MGRTRYKIIEPTAPHFMTVTTVNWIPIFTRPDTVKIILDSFDYLQKAHRLKLYGFVVLENHLHCITQSKDLAKTMSSFKSYTAKMIIRYLESQKANRVLDQLAFHKKAHKKDRKYQVWEEGMHPQWIQNKEMLRQKLEYIHLNPVKRGYVDEASHWRYSNARNYELGSGLIEVFCDW